MADKRKQLSKREIRPEEYTALYFEKLPVRAKELLFEFISPSFPYHVNDKAIIIDFLDFAEYEKCESPIEVIFCFAFDIMAAIKDIPGRLWLIPQKYINTEGGLYRADFWFDSYECDYGQNYKPYKLIVECDGYEYHHKTKQQVTHGNERDYDLKKAGYDILHFSGSQIFNEPFKCANDTLEYILSKI